MQNQNPKSLSDIMDDDPYKNLDAESRTYCALHDAMLEMYFDKKTKECINLAAKLLTKAACPALIRARCHMILAMRLNSSLSVGQAEEAIALLDGPVREKVIPEAFPTEQLEAAHRLLEDAKQREAAKQNISASGSSTTEQVATDGKALKKAVSALQSASK